MSIILTVPDWAIDIIPPTIDITDEAIIGYVGNANYHLTECKHKHKRGGPIGIGDAQVVSYVAEYDDDPKLGWSIFITSLILRDGKYYHRTVHRSGYTLSYDSSESQELIKQVLEDWPELKSFAIEKKVTNSKLFLGHEQ